MRGQSLGRQPRPALVGLLPATLAHLAVAAPVANVVHGELLMRSWCPHDPGGMNIPVAMIGDCRNCSERLTLPNQFSCYLSQRLLLGNSNMTLFRQWRHRLGLTQHQAADLLGYCKRRIEAYDRGEQEPPKIVKLGMAAADRGIQPFSTEDIAA